MFELLELLEEKDQSFMEKVHKDKSLLRFLQEYVYNPNKIITPYKVFKMHRYLRVEGRVDIKDVGEIGKYNVEMFRRLRAKEKVQPTMELRMGVEFFVRLQRKLLKNTSNKAQYRAMREGFGLMSEVDVKWATRFLCKKVILPKRLLEEFKNA